MYIILVAAAIGLTPPPIGHDIAGPSYWGDITQVGNKITITGNASWQGSGEIIDGKLHVDWVRRHDFKPAVGIYGISDNGAIIGAWSWSEDAHRNPDGSICAPLDNSETLRSQK